MMDMGRMCMVMVMYSQGAPVPQQTIIIHILSSSINIMLSKDLTQRRVQHQGEWNKLVVGDRHRVTRSSSINPITRNHSQTCLLV